MDLMNIKEYVAARKEAVYAKILEYLPKSEPLEYSEMLSEYSRRQGKYMRPGLLMLAGELFGATLEELVLPAAIMQISEDWMLMHDDLEDGSEMRRGKPALHRIYGNWQALNAGDAVQMRMWRMIMDYTKANGLKKGTALFDRMYSILDETVEGQYLDIKFSTEIKQIGKASEDMYFDIVGKKTSCYTVYGPMQIGAVVADQPKKVCEILERIGRDAGKAFQITDDILDMTADEKEFGKKRYGDLYEGKLTLIMLHAYNAANRAERARIDRIYKKERNSKTKAEIDFLAYVIEKYGSVEYARAEASRYGRMAQETLRDNQTLFPENEYKEVFTSAVESLFIRKV